MKLQSVGEIISTRNLYLRGDTQKRIQVLIGKPCQFPDSPDYFCPFQISGIGKEKVFYAGGVDGVQSLQLVMVMIGAQVSVLNESLGGKLCWAGDVQGGLGFPAL